MNDLELLIRKCSEEEAENIRRNNSLDSSQVKYQVNGITYSSDCSKWVSSKIDFINQYSPKGVKPENYSCAVLLHVVPGTIEALRIYRDSDDKSMRVRRGPRGSFGIPPALCDWFNNRIIKTQTIQVTNNVLTEFTNNPSPELLMNEKNEYATFMAFSPKFLDKRHFTSLINRDRMSWIKTSILWTLWRSEWGYRPGQERIIELDVSKEYLDSLFSSAASHQKSDMPSIIYQTDPDRRIIGARWIRREEPYFVKAGHTTHFGIRREALHNYIDRISQGNIKDITEKMQDIYHTRPLHPRQEILNMLNLVPVNYDEKV